MIATAALGLLTAAGIAGLACYAAVLRRRLADERIAEGRQRGLAQTAENRHVAAYLELVQTRCDLAEAWDVANQRWEGWAAAEQRDETRRRQARARDAAYRARKRAARRPIVAPVTRYFLEKTRAPYAFGDTHA